jgi:hypothetical protein
LEAKIRPKSWLVLLNVIIFPARRPGNKAQAIDHGAGRKKDMLHVLCAPIHFVDLSEEHRCCGSEENNGSG